MANPAQLLLNQLNAWNQPQKTADIARETKDPHAWLRHRIAVRHLDAIEELLDQMDGVNRNTAVFRRYFPIWTQIVFAHPWGWGTSGSGKMDRVALEHLENLADRLEDFV